MGRLHESDNCNAFRGYTNPCEMCGDMVRITHQHMHYDDIRFCSRRCETEAEPFRCTLCPEERTDKEGLAYFCTDNNDPKPRQEFACGTCIVAIFKEKGPDMPPQFVAWIEENWL